MSGNFLLKDSVNVCAGGTGRLLRKIQEGIISKGLIEMYKIEPHLHTKHVSKCGWLYAEELAKRYHEAGYSGIAVTDHYNVDTWKYLGIDAQTIPDVVPQFLDGYEKLKAACEPYGIVVYRSAELRFYENDNDYLYYGFDPEILAQPHTIMDMGIAKFSQMARAQGGLLIQAHPFRAKCVPVAPMFLDGIEIFNASPRHLYHNNNDMALAMAEHEGPGFIRTAGSDCHRLEDIGRSGILSETLPQDTYELADLLRSGSYELIIPEE